MLKTLHGHHSFVAYEGDIEYEVDEKSGLLVPANPIVYESPVYDNLVVTSGKNDYLQRLSAGLGVVSAINAFGHIGVGTDSTAAAAGQTQLNPSVSGSVLIQACDASFPSGPSSLVLTFKATFGTGVANFNWNEAGIFNGTTNGTSRMFNRVIIGPFNKTSAVSIAYTTTITQS
jgi:hypothetical protein